MALIAGTSTEIYTGSMAEAIEQAFLTEWPAIMGTGSPGSNPQMKLLCIAIARGVIDHLVHHPEAFEINVDVGGTIYPATVVIQPAPTP